MLILSPCVRYYEIDLIIKVSTYRGRERTKSDRVAMVKGLYSILPQTIPHNLQTKACP